MSRRKFQREDKKEPANMSKTVTLFLFDFPELQIYLLARHVQRTFDEDKHENQMFSLSQVFLLSSFRFAANNKQSSL